MSDVIEQSDLEKVGTAFSRDTMLMVRDKTRAAIHLIASKVKPGMVEEDASGRSQLDAVDAAGHQRYPDLIFEVAYLPAERRLRGVQRLLRGNREASRLGDGDEIAKMAELHIGFHI